MNNDNDKTVFSMKIIGITAPIGCGKSYIADLFAEHGIQTIDADKVYHSMICTPTELVSEISDEFGKDVLSADGALDRKKLGELVFSNPQKLSRLNEITHNAVIRKMLGILKQHECDGAKAVTVQVPLMFESEFYKHCDLIICVAADTNTRIERICKRDACSRAEAIKRINNQKDIEFYIANSDKTVYNNTYDDPIEQVNCLINDLNL